MKLSNDKYLELISLANAARGNSYSPFSHFSVGAALLTSDGKVYLGTNIENSSYGATVCAERVAIFSAVAAGERSFSAIAVVGGKDNEKGGRECQPCALCLQVMAELCDADFEIVLEDGEGGYSVYPFSELLKKPFKF